LPEARSLKPETRALLEKVSVASLTLGLLKRGLRNQFMYGLTPVAPISTTMVGPAFTLRFIPAREDIDSLDALRRADNVQRRAFEECPPGSVLVIDAGDGARSGSAGDLMIGRLKVRGGAGVVTNGGFRDLQGVRKVGLAAFQRQPSPPATPVGLHPVDFDVPIGCAGVAVYPGDIIVGDSDGVVVLPAEMADDLAIEAMETTKFDEFAELQINLGRSIIDVFPPTPEMLLEYEGWKKTNV
jgi:regulator of RNase E activity RraA